MSIKICILWPDNADIFYEKALSVHQLCGSWTQQKEGNKFVN